MAQSTHIYHWANELGSPDGKLVEALITALLRISPDKTPFPSPTYSMHFSPGFYAARAEARGADPEKIKAILLLLFG